MLPISEAIRQVHLPQGRVLPDGQAALAAIGVHQNVEAPGLVLVDLVGDLAIVGAVGIGPLAVVGLDDVRDAFARMLEARVAVGMIAW